MADLMTETAWSFTSTGAGKAYNLRGYSQGVTFYVETSSGCTATVQIQSRGGSSNGDAFTSPVAFAVLSTINCTLADCVCDQFMGPLGWVRPRVTDKNSGTVKVRVISN